MENKPQNVFEKLDKQGEQIDDITSKLEGISINDLYALAKRTWDYGDYQTAQKYYNHISLLKPLDWEAPLYASLCNFKGYHNMFFWTKVPEQVEKITVSTIKYINNLELDSNKKEDEMSKCIEIIKRYMLRTKDHYFEYKNDYDDTDADYIYVLEEYYLNVYNEIKNIDLKAVRDFISVLADAALSIIDETRKISSKITKEVYDGLCKISSKKYDINYDEIIERNKELAKPKKDLSYDEIKEIKLNGIMYFEYNDKVISSRIYKRSLIIGLIMVLFSTIGIVLSFLGKWYWFIPFIIPLITGLLLIIKAITQKDKIKCSSLLCAHREKNRLSSDGNIVTERKNGIMGLFAFLGSQLNLYIGVFMAIFSFENNNTTYAIIFIIAILFDVIASFTTIRLVNEHHSKINGKYTYLYKNKIYNLN